MKGLSIGQKKILAGVFANGGVAWFSTGVIVPVIAGKTLSDFIATLTVGFLFAAVFVIIALTIARGLKS